MGQVEDPSAGNCASAVASEDQEEDGDDDEEVQVRRGRDPAGAPCARFSASAVSGQRRRLALVRALRQQLASRPLHGRQDDVEEAQACATKRKSASLLEASVESRKRLKHLRGKPPPRPRQSVDVGPAACDFCQRIFMSRHAVDVHQSRNQTCRAKKTMLKAKQAGGLEEMRALMCDKSNFPESAMHDGDGGSGSRGGVAAWVTRDAEERHVGGRGGGGVDGGGGGKSKEEAASAQAALHSGACTSVFTQWNPALRGIHDLEEGRGIRDLSSILDDMRLHAKAAAAKEAWSGSSADLESQQQQRGEHSVMQLCLRELGHLALEHSSEVGAAGGIEALAMVMQAHKGDAGVQRNACVALANLAYNSDDNKERMRKAGCIAHIVGVMSVHQATARVQKSACGVLANLAYCNRENALLIQQASGIEAVVAAMTFHRKDLYVQVLACEALGNVAASTCSEGMMKMMDDFEGEPCIFAAQAATTVQHEHATGIEKYTSVVGSGSGEIEAMVQAMQIHRASEELQVSACRALKHLAFNRDNAARIAAVGGIQAVVRSMQSHKKVFRVQEQALLALRNLTVTDGNRSEFVKEGGIVAVVEAMEAHKEAVDLQEQCLLLGKTMLESSLSEFDSLRTGATWFDSYSCNLHAEGLRVLATAMRGGFASDLAKQAGIPGILEHIHTLLGEADAAQPTPAGGQEHVAALAAKPAGPALPSSQAEQAEQAEAPRGDAGAGYRDAHPSFSSSSGGADDAHGLHTACVRIGAQRVRVSGVILISPTHAQGTSFSGVNGVFEREASVCNFRSVYRHEEGGTRLWWGNNSGNLCWVMGPADKVGTGSQWAYRVSDGASPEQGSGTWRVYNYCTDLYEPQDTVEVVEFCRGGGGAAAAAGEMNPAGRSPLVEGRGGEMLLPASPSLCHPTPSRLSLQQDEGR